MRGDAPRRREFAEKRRRNRAADALRSGRMAARGETREERTMPRFMPRLRADTAGATAIEYALLASLIAIAGAVTPTGAKLVAIFTAVQAGFS
jgi:Flp pilus assembly pilin Flp